MSRPKLLDLFCGAGGAAMGYHRAGFDVVGVDIKPQPRYPFEFVQGDALEYLRLEDRAGDYFDAIHASPPCQAYSIANNTHGRTDHPDLIEPTRALLEQTGLPYVIENVPGAPLRNPIMICGLALGLNVKRHRLFECAGFAPPLVPPCTRHDADYLSVFGGGARTRTKQIGRTAKDGPMLRRGTKPLANGQAAMGIDWMIRDELSQAIPPAYTELIGHQLMQYLKAAA